MKTNYKSIILSVSLAVMGLMFFNGAFGQVVNSDYSESSTTATTVEHTAGKTLGLYAEPDAFYNPNYNATATPTPWTLNSTSTWTWTTGSLTQGGNTGAPKNYVELTNPAVGNYSVVVKEGNTTTGCTDGTGTTTTVVILPAPTFDFDGATTTGHAFTDGCGDVLGKTIAFALTAEDITNGKIFAQWRLRKFDVTMDASGNPSLGAPDGADVVYTWDKNGSANQTLNSESWTMAATSGGAAFNADGVAAPSLADYTLSASLDFTVPSGKAAYLYRWVIDKTAGDGVNDRISRKSDYVDGGFSFGTTGTTTVYGTDKTIDIYVVRAPVTGPIYHIPNTFGEGL